MPATHSQPEAFRQRVLSQAELDHLVRTHPSVASLMDRHNLTVADVEQILLSLRYDHETQARLVEHLPHVITGHYRDRFEYADGRVVESDPTAIPNLIVNSFSILLAAVCWSTRSPTWPGITYMALGQGNSSWDSSLPPPLATDVQLYSEIIRKPVTLNDIDSMGSVVLTGPTGMLLCVTTYNPGEAIATIREFGLFGGLGASSTNGGTMADHVSHGAIVKSLSADFSFTRSVSLSF